MNGPTISPGPDLPNAVSDHCVVNSDEWMKAIIIGGSIGGMVGPNVVDSTHIFCFDNQTWYQGPSLMHGRYMHSCGILKDGNDYILVTAGGIGSTGYPLTSVELYKPLVAGNSWYAGPDLAAPRYE